MTPLPWVKLHTEILSDPKLMQGMRRGLKGLGVLPWLLPFARRAGDEGRLTIAGEAASAADIAAELPDRTMTAKYVAAGLESLLTLGVLTADDDGALRFTRWGERAGDRKPSDRPEAIRTRVTKFRERHAADNGNAPRNALHENGNALRNAPDREIEKEGEEEAEKPAAASSPAGETAGAKARSEVAGAVGDVLAARFERHVAERLGADAAVAHLREALSWLAGMHGAVLTPAQLAQALGDYVANRAQPNMRLFRGYLRNAAPRAEPPPAVAPPAPRASGNGSFTGRPSRIPAIAAAPETKLE
jgi:hypothetical protein